MMVMVVQVITATTAAVVPVLLGPVVARAGPARLRRAVVVVGVVVVLVGTVVGLGVRPLLQVRPRARGGPRWLPRRCQRCVDWII